MSSTAANQNRTVPGFTCTPWDEAGLSELIVSGRSLEQVMEGALAGLILVLKPQSMPEALAPKSTRIRGEGRDAGTLSIDLAKSLFAELDALGVIPVEFTIDGLVRSERGFVGWASISVVNLQPDQKMTFPGLEIVYQRNEKNDYELGLRLQRTTPPTLSRS